MKYVKIFESHVQESIIKEIWGVDPYIFYDIISSSMEEFDIWGELNLHFVFRDPIGGEIYTCFYLGETIKDGLYSEKISLLNRRSREIVIEALVDMHEGFRATSQWVERDDEIYKVISRRLEESKTPYKTYQPSNFGDSIYLKFKKI